MSHTTVKLLMIALLSIPVGILFVGTVVNLNQSIEEFWEIKKESRPISVLPNWGQSFDDQRIYFSNIETFLSDRLFGRKILLVLKTRINLVMRQALNPQKVVMGRSGWLFFGDSHDKNMTKFMGKDTLSEVLLKQFSQYFSQLDEYACHKNGIPTFLFIVPGKSSIYPEYIPKRFPVKGRTILDQIMERKLPFHIYDFRQLFLDAKRQSDHLLYYPCDSHWNHYGAYIAYREMMKQINTKIEVSTLQLSEEQFEKQLNFRGDQFKHLGRDINCYCEQSIVRNGFFSDELDILLSHNLSNWVLVERNFRINPVNHPYIKVRNPKKQKKALLLGDSFTKVFSDYMNQTFGEVLYTHYREKDDNYFADIISSFNPDVVIVLRAERTLDILDYIKVKDNHIDAKRSSCTVLNHEEFLQMISNQNLIKTVQKSQKVLNIETLGNDGYLVFNVDSILNKVDAIQLNVTLTTPQKELFQLFYTTSSEDFFDEEKSIRKMANKGKQKIEFYLNRNDLTGTFRLDFGTSSSKFQLNKIEICTMSKVEQTLQ
jgi:alginate O-acetyltransferase complex protein AlgJ